MSRQKVDSEMIVSIAASKLSGALPALDGSALTGIEDVITGASDPVISTNPSGGVGSVYLNTSDGEMFVCTDATAGANIWKNVGLGEGNISSYTPGSFGGQGGGTAFGYHAGGLYPGQTNIQGKYSYANDGNATSVTVLAQSPGQGKWAAAGFQSDTHGYSAGGQLPTTSPNVAQEQMVEKHNFANNTSHVLGNISLCAMVQGTGTNSSTHGYCIGEGGFPGLGAGEVQKISFANDTSFNLVGDAYNGGTIYGLTGGSGHASVTHGYRAGGNTNTGSTLQQAIEKWTFASDANSAFVANMHGGPGQGLCGSSSDYHGYIMHTAAAYDKFSFSSDADSVNVGNLFYAPNVHAGSTSSTTYAYCHGGGYPPNPVIQKGAFASDGDMTEVGNCTNGRAYVWGYQD